MNDDALLFLPAVELASRLDSGELTSVALTTAYLARIERIAPALNCFVTVTADRALADARAADERRGRGERGGVLGLPYAAKDLIDTAGIRTTCGTRAYLDRVPARDAAVIARLAAAGAVLIGKCSLTELANAFINRHPEANLGGACRNPWDRTRWAGGSSSGSASAVAAGLCAFALGSETQGSLDTPASFCGVTALRPTYDLVPRDGCLTLSWSLDKVGVIARDVRDAALVLPVLAAQGPLTAAPQPLRIGIVEGMAEPTPDPGDDALWTDAKAQLAASGASLVPIELPRFPRSETMSVILGTDILVAFEDFIRTGKINSLYNRQPWPEILADARSDEATAEDYVKAMRVRTVIQRTYRDLFTNLDAIACFGFPLLPPLVEDTVKFPKKPSAKQLIGTDGNLAGLPAITLPIGFTASGLPRSMHVVGAPYHEHKLVGVAAAYQSRTQHHTKRPPL